MRTDIVIDLMRSKAPAELTLLLDLKLIDVADRFADQLLDEQVLAMRIGTDVQDAPEVRRADLNAAVFRALYELSLGISTPVHFLQPAADRPARMRVLRSAIRDAAQHAADEPAYVIAASFGRQIVGHAKGDAARDESSSMLRAAVASASAASFFRMQDAEFDNRRAGHADAESLPLDLAVDGVPESSGQPLVVIQRDARQRRDELFAEDVWLTAMDVEQLLRDTTTDSNPSQFASRLRREKRLFGVRYRGQFLHPAFQFDPNTGQLFAALPEVLRWLPDEPDGWAAAFWWFQPSPHLDGKTPAHALLRAPVAVAHAAEKDFRRTDDEW